MSLDKLIPKTNPKLNKKSLSGILARHAGLKVADTWKEVEEYEEEKILHAACFTPVYGQQFIYCTNILDKIKYSDWLDYDTLINSGVYEQWQLGLGAIPDGRHEYYKMAIRVPNPNGADALHFIMFQANAYVGVGGLFVAPAPQKRGFVIEPVHNWVKRYEVAKE